MQLTNQAKKLTAGDLLFDKVNPSEKLTKTYPYHYEDVVNSNYYLKPPRQQTYQKNMFYGYHYFKNAQMPVRYPFGFDLSYTQFKYSNLQVRRTDPYEMKMTTSIT